MVAFAAAKRQVPPVNYMTGVDDWVSICTAFVFAAIGRVFASQSNLDYAFGIVRTAISQCEVMPARFDFQFKF